MYDPTRGGVLARPKTAVSGSRLYRCSASVKLPSSADPITRLCFGDLLVGEFRMINPPKLDRASKVEFEQKKGKWSFPVGQTISKIQRGK